MMVPGEGPVPAERMIIGEAPGREETRERRPFIGQSGRLLVKALGQFGLNREELYITNVCKAMPLDNEGRIRPPTTEEQMKDFPLLLKEIKEVAPEKILLLGKVAGDLFLPDDTIVKAWHPSYVLRKGGEDEDSEVYQEWLKQLRPFAEDGELAFIS